MALMTEVWITAYDAPTAQIAVAGGADGILVGDSVANVVYGLARTAEVTLQMMLPHFTAVVEHAGDLPVVADMPAGTYDTPEMAIQTAKCIATCGTKYVKLEGAKPAIIKALIDDGFQVMGHLGLLPQTAQKLTKVAKTEAEQAQLVADAQAIANMGCERIVLECVPNEAALAVAAAVDVPIVAIGCGAGLSGQIRVMHDVVGLTENPPPFAKAYGNARAEMVRAVADYVADVQ